MCRGPPIHYNESKLLKTNKIIHSNESKLEDFKMNYKKLKCKIKEEQKLLAIEIRRGKYLRKPSHWEGHTEEEEDQLFSTYDGETFFKYWKIESLSYKYRHRHIAYCTMFNRTPYEKIETPKNGNSADKRTIENCKKQWVSHLDETLRDNS